MEKNNKIILGALLIIFFSMLSFNLDLTGKVISSGLPDLTIHVSFVDKDSGQQLDEDKIKLGDWANIKVTLENIGDEPTPTYSISNKVTIKKDGKTYEHSDLVPFKGSNVLQPKSFFTKIIGDFQFNAPGKYCFDVKSDTTKKIAEANEDNNEFKGTSCITVKDDTTKIIKEDTKKEEKKTSSKKFKKKSKIDITTPTKIKLSLYETYKNENKDVLLQVETCDLSDTNTNCIFTKELEQHKNYLVRGSTTTPAWKVQFVRIIDDSNRVFLSKNCNSPICELRTELLLKKDTKLDQNIKNGLYKIGGSAKKNI